MIRLKSREEMNYIAEASIILSDVLKKLSNYCEVGQTTEELNALAHDAIIAAGAQPSFLGYHDFPGSICVSVNDAVIHGIPSSYKLRSGDIVGIDCGVQYKGYYSDAAITLGIGKIDAKHAELLDVTKACLDAGIQAMSSGKHVRDISAAVFAYADHRRYGVIREYCGHGVGLAIHEDPPIPNYVTFGQSPRLREGMVLAIEPMICMGNSGIDVLDDAWTVVTSDGSMAAHFEHTVAITANGVEVLTA